MSCLIWNCRGLGNPCIGYELADMVRVKDLSVMFLAETWADKARLKEVKRNLGFDNLHFVERINRGEVWLFFGNIMWTCRFKRLQKTILMLL